MKIEQVLEDMYILLDNDTKTTVFSGEVCCLPNAAHIITREPMKITRYLELLKKAFDVEITSQYVKEDKVYEFFISFKDNETHKDD
jgi:hypothetical protein